MGEPARITHAQRAVLEWLPTSPTAYAHWGGKVCGHPPMAALKACLRRGWVERRGHVSMGLYALTPAGRHALAAQERSDGR